MPDSPHWLQLLTVSIVVLVGAVTDLRTRKIPNWLTLGALPIGFLMAGLLTGTSGLVSAGLGMFLALLIYFPLYLLRAMGAGDAKLMAAIATFLGPFMWLHLFLFASVLGGIVAIIFTAAKGEFRNTLNRSVEILRQLAYFRAPYASNPTLDIRSARSLSLPHGAVICLSWIVLLVAWEQFDFRLIRL